MPNYDGVSTLADCIHGTRSLRRRWLVLLRSAEQNELDVFRCCCSV
jgi:hypothetical protein